MKVIVAENLRHFLGDLTKENMQVFVDDEDSGGFYEVTGAVERDGCVLLQIGQYWHSLPNEGDSQGEKR